MILFSMADLSKGNGLKSVFLFLVALLHKPISKGLFHNIILK